MTGNRENLWEQGIADISLLGLQSDLASWCKSLLSGNREFHIWPYPRMWPSYFILTSEQHLIQCSVEINNCLLILHGPYLKMCSVACDCIICSVTHVVCVSHVRCSSGCVLFLVCTTEQFISVKCVGISIDLCIYSHNYVRTE